MNLFTFVHIVGLLYTVTESSAQYYYVSAGQPALFQFRSNSLPQQFSTYDGNQQFSTFHGNQQFSTFHGNQQFPTFNENQQFPTFHGNQQFHRSHVPVAQQNYVPHANLVPSVQTQVNSNLRHNDNTEYRGFAYQTVSDNNAVSHVLFVSGPGSQKFTSKVFSSMSPKAAKQNEEVGSSRNLASDLLDPLKHAEYKTMHEDYMFPKNTENVYSSHTFDFDKPENSFGNFFHNPGSAANVINFYSSPKTGLFAQQANGYPANTFPLQAPPTSPLFGILQPTLDTMTKTTTESSIANDDDTVVIDNSEGQESVRVNTRFQVNDVFENRVKSLKTNNVKADYTQENDKVAEKNDYVEDIGTTLPTTEFITETVKRTAATNIPDLITTNVLPIGITEKVEGTMSEVDQTDNSVQATPESVDILDRSVQITTQSIQTTSQSDLTMEKSIQTTDETTQTIDQSTETIKQFGQTTDQSAQSTGQPIETTSQFAQIMDKSVRITDQSIETTSQFIQTTDSSVLTTGQLIETTVQYVQTTDQSMPAISQQDQTTEMAETTAVNADKGTVTTEELGTTTSDAPTTAV